MQKREHKQRFEKKTPLKYWFASVCNCKCVTGCYAGVQPQFRGGEGEGRASLLGGEGEARRHRLSPVGERGGIGMRITFYYLPEIPQSREFGIPANTCIWTSESLEAKTSQDAAVLAQNPTGFIPHSSKVVGIWDTII